jgi:hypothetical protein
MAHVALTPRLTVGAKSWSSRPPNRARGSSLALKTVWGRSVGLAILGPVTSTAHDRPPLASFWNDLPRDGKFLLSTVAVETLGTGLVLSFGFIYLHEVLGFTIETAGTLLAVPAIVGMAVVGPAGAAPGSSSSCRGCGRCPA